MAKTQNAVGRPSELTPKLKKTAKTYLLGAYSESGDTIPTVEGLAEYLGKGRSTVYKYIKEDQEFADIVDQILTIQGRLLINGGLMGAYNASITKLILSKHGYTERREVDNKSSDGSMTPSTPLTADELKEAIKTAIEKI